MKLSRLFSDIVISRILFQFQTAQQRLRAMVAQALAASTVNATNPNAARFQAPVNGGSLPSAQATVAAED